MHRFYIPPEQWNPDELRLRGSEAHHARDVLRIRPGDEVIVFNGKGVEVTAEITDIGTHEIALRKLREVESPPLRHRITLALAIPKGRNMDLIVQKAVELGATDIAPLISARTVVELHASERVRKQKRWQHLVIEAAKQCGQNWLPQVQLPCQLKDFFSEPAVAGDARQEVAAGSAAPPKASRDCLDTAPLQQLRLIGSLQPDARSLRQIFADLRSKHSKFSADVLIMIGPEGDFTVEELAWAKQHGCTPITLGPVVLRVETAAIYCLSVLSYELTQ